MNWRRLVADIHLWLSLVVGLQVLAWMVSGLFMVSQPIERVRSEHRLAEHAHADLASYGTLAAPDQVMAAMGAPVAGLSLELVGERLLYAVETTNEVKALFDARTGARVSPIDEAYARQIAEAAIAGDVAAMRVALIESDAPIEYRGALPAWRIDFDDAENLSVYIDAYTGRVVARRSDTWRVFDIMWALHIMDYRERENFNHPLLIAVTALALIMTVFGLVLLAIRLPQRFRRKTGETSA
ncbi:MAG: PepSY domain-containing protein [Hyphomonadaceae bacterium JAD_PAG50586_4]|nr:MAG: PepSY domain-containing protein [Hyphomonadaceae bacterium JAD_PAG50586_4]